MIIKKTKIQSFNIENFLLDLEEITEFEIFQNIESSVGFGYEENSSEQSTLIFFSVELQITERTEADDIIREIQIKAFFQGSIPSLTDDLVFDGYSEAIQKICDYITISINLDNCGEDSIDFSDFLEKISQERESKKFVSDISK